ncbi:MAG TPA: hypothetical protein VFZ25_11820 [Chloroflexota bacterium]|nr:hypothetical protein [Chloroflexota bacterium]
MQRLLSPALVLAIIGVTWSIARILQSPSARAGLVWAVRSWFVPPDADAGWEQGPG